MSEEIFSASSHRKKYSKYEIRKQQEKALQSYQQIATLQELSKNEQEIATSKAEAELDQFITSNKNSHGK
jgi:hypothetical protein